MRLALEVVFWVSCALIVWTQVGYALALAGIARVLRAGGCWTRRTHPAQRAGAAPLSPNGVVTGLAPALSLLWPPTTSRR